MSTRSERRCRARRRVKAGFPKPTVFQTPEELAAYFGGETITCLECGKECRSLGLHVRLHEMTPDDYREAHGIPWTFGLTSKDSRESYGEHARRLWEEGIVNLKPPPPMSRPHRKHVPAHMSHTMQNLTALNAGKSGDETRRRAARSRFGSDEWREKLRNRPGQQERGRHAGKSCLGKKQTPEQVRKRVASMLATKARKKAENGNLY